MNTSQKQLIEFTLILVAAVHCPLAVQSAQSAEPVYDGKALSEWLVALHVGLSDEEVVAASQQHVNTDDLIKQKRRRDEEAIRQIGTNGLPTLLDIVSVEQWNRKLVFSKLKSKDFREGAGRKDVPTDTLRGMAVDGFAIWGPM